MNVSASCSPGGWLMTRIRHHTDIIRDDAAVAAALLLLMAVLLSGCGGTSQAASAADPLQLVKAPPGFRVGTCEFLSGPSVRCFRHKSFAALDVGVFTALIRASGLTPVKATIACPHLLRPRPGAAMTRDTCQGRAYVGSSEVSVFATTIKARLTAVKPARRALTRSLLGTTYDVARPES
jgi:hypothetical protein